jgi:TRAP-type C4-dicarboxylate transport system substrate-binding protein
MSITPKSRLAAALVAVLVALPAGCDLGAGGDKAGGGTAPKPVELRLAVATEADDAGAPLARFFASRATALSKGSMRVRVVFDAAGQQVAEPEARVARMVHEGEFELGWIGSPAWDRLGVTSFQALQAPFLVTSYALLDSIATGPLARRMLAALPAEGFVPLALVPDRLRHPFGVEHPLASPDDFAGARVRVLPSHVTNALMRALGATPVHISWDRLNAAMAAGKIDGTEYSLGNGWPGGRFLTANVTFFANAVTVFALDRAYRELDQRQREVIHRAARQTVAYAVAHPAGEATLMRGHCDYGQVVSASHGDLAGLIAAARPVYAELEDDAQTRALIAAIRRLQKTIPRSKAVVPHCAQATPSSQDAEALSTLDGTYRWRLTNAGAAAAGTRRDDPDIGTVSQMTLSDGRWLMEPAGSRRNPRPGDIGSYGIVGNRIVFDWPQVASTLTFTFERHANGDLDLKPVLPMHPGDRFNWASAPWKRIGPPIRALP